jgi:translation initiation factor 1
VGKKHESKPAPAQAPFHAPFATLAGKLGMEPKPAQPSSAPALEAPPKGPARAVVRLERKGRGGKEATIVEKLDLSLRERERWLSDAKRALGCGGALEGDAIVLQGDLRARLKAWLEEKGVRKVTLG